MKRLSKNWLNMRWLTSLIGGKRAKSPTKQRRNSLSCGLEALELRSLMAADTLPVLLVIADQQDFYYKEYGDTRLALEASGLQVRVAATTTDRSIPHANTGEPVGTDGGVVPDIALSQVESEDYSAIVFVGGWGSSMYQYSFPGDYQNDRYDGDLATKEVVNNLINDFVDADKHVAGICHGVTVLAWARVDGVSPLSEKNVSVPFIGSPAVFYQNTWYGYYELGQREQIVANGGIANSVSGQYGDPNTVADDVVVDGRIITAENYDAASEFGRIIAREVIASAGHVDPPVENHSPVASDGAWEIDENTTAGTMVGTVNASDPDGGQTLSYTIVSGNVSGAFAIDSATGQITVANSSALDFETTPEFHLVVQVADNGETVLADTANVTISLRDVLEVLPGTVARSGNDVIAQGTNSGDTVYVWSGARAEQIFVWINGASFGPYAMPAGGRVIVFGGDGNDRMYATDARYPVSLYGEAGHDVLTGGSAGDQLDGGGGVDRVWGSAGDDLILGGAGNDYLYGLAGNDILVGGDGDDYLDGDIGHDVLVGGQGSDHVLGGAGDDLLIGGTTSYDNDRAALESIRQAWARPVAIADRAAQLIAGTSAGVRLATGETVQDDNASDTLCGGPGDDLLFASIVDSIWTDSTDLVRWLV